MLYLLVTALAVLSPQETDQPEGWWGDLDNDGLPDFYSIADGRDDVLLRNLGDGQLVDATTESGLAGCRSRAVCPKDFDNDGRVDLLLVTRQGRLRLFQGRKGGAFDELSASSGVDVAEDVVRARWIDYDLDGRLDLVARDSLGRPVFLHCLEGPSFELLQPDIPKAVGIRTAAPSDPGPALPTAASASSGPDPAAPAPGPGPGGKQPKTATPKGIPGGSTLPSMVAALCAKTLSDFSGGACLSASSMPVLGMLYPLSQDWYVDAATGYVGLGTTTPGTRLDVAGDATVSGITTLEGDAVLDKTRIDGWNSTGATTTVVDPTGPSNGGLIELRNNGGMVGTIEMRGDAGSDEGQITLRDGSGTTSVSIRGSHVFGSGEGGVVTTLNGSGIVTGRLIGDDGGDAGRVTLRKGLGNNSIIANLGNFGTNVGELRLNEFDGSQAFWLSVDELTGTASNGTQTFALDRQTGDAAQDVGGNGFLKAAVMVDGFTGSVGRSFNHLSGSLMVQRVAQGTYTVQFSGTDVSSRFFLVQPDSASPRSSSVGAVSDTVSVVTKRQVVSFVPPATVLTTHPATDVNFTLFVF